MTSPGISVMSTEEKMERLANKYLKLRGQYDALKKSYSDSQREIRALREKMSSAWNSSGTPAAGGSSSPSDGVNGESAQGETIARYKERIAEMEGRLRELEGKNAQPKSSPAISVSAFGAMKGLLVPSASALKMGEHQGRVEELEGMVEELQTRIEVVDDDCKRLQDELASVTRSRDGVVARNEELTRESEKQAGLLRDLRMSSESASRRICALEEENERLEKKVSAGDSTVSTLEEDRRALKEANEVLGQRIADLERESGSHRDEETRRKGVAGASIASVTSRCPTRNVATETIPRDASSISSIKDPLDLPGLVSQQRHTQVFTDESTSRAPTEPGDHRDLWTASAPRSPHSFQGLMSSPSYGGAMKLRADLVSSPDNLGPVTVKLSSSSSAEAISPRSSTLCMLVEALRQEIHQANAKHLILVSEIALSASHLSTVSEDRDVAVNEVRALRAALEEVELELSTTKMGYDEQLGALTDHLCQMQQLVEEKEGLVTQTLEHRIYCGRCGCWNQLKSLASGGGQCSLCGGRVLVLGWVEPPPEPIDDEKASQS